MTQFLEKYTSHFIERFERVLLWEGVGDRTKLQHIDLPSPSGHRRVSFSFSWAAQPGAMFSFQHLLTNWSGLQTQSGIPKAPSARWWLSLPNLVSNSSDLQLTDFLSTPSYIIVQSPTQYLPMTGHRNVSFLPSLEWHVWSSSSRNNCYAVPSSPSSGASVFGCTVGF